MGKLKVGDRVKLVGDSYASVGLYLNTIHPVCGVVDGGVEIEGSDGAKDWFFFDDEVELVTPEVVTEKYGFKVGDECSYEEYPGVTFTVFGFDHGSFKVLTSRSDGGGWSHKDYPGKSIWGFNKNRTELKKIVTETPAFVPDVVVGERVKINYANFSNGYETIKAIEINPTDPERTKYFYESSGWDYRSSFTKIEPETPKDEPAFIVISMDEFEDYTRYTKADAEKQAKELAEEGYDDYVVLQAGSKFAHVSQVVETPITL